MKRTIYDPKECYVKNVHCKWRRFIQNAIDDINVAAPGLYLYLVQNEDDCKVHIYGIEEEEAYTTGDIQSQKKAYVFLGDSFGEEKQTSVHELLHALGFGHEHQRPDASASVDTRVGENDPDWKSNFEQDHDICGITRFDPFSVMLYCEDDRLQRKQWNDPIWKLKDKDEINRELSELDKVGLNMVFRPCRHSHYDPKISPVTRLYYCGRKVMSRHNYPGENTTDGYCGPDNWANCPACRTLKTDKIQEIWRKGKWQGWSGLVYCNRWFGVQEPGHDGMCGPDNGPPCPECRYILYPKRTDDDAVETLTLIIKHTDTCTTQ